MNVSQVIEKFGGYHEAAQLFGVSRSLLTKWEYDGIPAKRWMQIAKLAEIKKIDGVTIETLSSASPTKVAA